MPWRKPSPDVPVFNDLTLTSEISENGFATLSGTFSDVGTKDTYTLDSTVTYQH